MPREIKMPKLSDTMEEGTLNVWRKREGESVAKGDVLLEVETDKADMEYEAYVAGTLVRILVPAGETVSVGTPIAVVRLERDSDEDLQAFLAERGLDGEARPQAEAASGDAKEAAGDGSAAAGQGAGSGTRRQRSEPARSGAGEAAQRSGAGTGRASRQGPAEQAPAARPGADEPPPESGDADATVFAAPRLAASGSDLPFFLPDPDRVRATPRARLLARERSVDLSEIAGSGPEGAVLVADIERYLEALEQAPAPDLPGDVPVTPVAQRIADDLHVDLSRVKGTGPGGRITKRDLRTHLEEEERRGGTRALELYGDEVKLSQKRKFLVRNMVESKRTAPHFYLSVDVDAEPLEELRKRLRGEERRVTFTHLLVKACASAIERMPEVNATFREDRIVRFNPINVAVAVDVQDELVAPVLKQCQGRRLDDLARDLDVLIERARERKLAPEDYSDGTFTISNLGMVGVERFYAILTPPQSMVLSVGALRSEPVVREGRVVVGRRMNLGLGVDHRVLDGVKAAQFLMELRGILEAPEGLAGDPGGEGGAAD